jgi:predicted O-linked N-acetylglucosamine transferase (SPINDLY family)
MSHLDIDEAERAIANGHQREDRGAHEEALACYRAAINAAPNFPRAHLNVGNALRNLRRYDEALAAFRRALTLNPSYAPARFNLGTLLAEIGDREAATTELNEALRLQPTLEMREKVVGAESYQLFSGALREVQDPKKAAQEHIRVGQLISSLARPPFTSWANTPEPDRILRVGYVSGDFGAHPVSLFLRALLPQHDRARFDVYCYSTDPIENDPVRTVTSSARVMRNVAHITDGDLAELVRTDEIDILVDLAGHTEKNRLSMFARHAAPVQVTWLGYLNTTGLREIDYRVCDWHTDPAGAEALHTEELYRMPHSQWCYAPWPGTHVLPNRVQQSTEIVFGSANQHMKVSDGCLDLWSQILRRVPAARLIVLDVRDRYIGESITARLKQRGIPRDRIELRGRLSINAYYQAIGEFDIALDTFPHNGATTTCDTLWMNVPIVAMRGSRGISRCTYSILKSLGMDELIVASEDEYIALNVRLATEGALRGALCTDMRKKLAASPLMDAKRFAKDLEAGYRAMWRRWCERSNRSESVPTYDRT